MKPRDPRHRYWAFARIDVDTAKALDMTVVACLRYASTADTIATG